LIERECIDRDIFDFCFARCAGVTRCDKYLLNLRRLCGLPCQRARDRRCR
jgi:hypothetical protein